MVSGITSMKMVPWHQMSGSMVTGCQGMVPGSISRREGGEKTARAGGSKMKEDGIQRRKYPKKETVKINGIDYFFNADGYLAE